MAQSSTSQLDVIDDNYESFLGMLQANVDSECGQFATEKDFHQLHEVKALAWRELPLLTIYHVQHVKKIRTPTGGDSFILYLYEKDSTTPRIHWATSLLVKELLAMKDLRNLYIKSCGMKKSVATGREYYNYQLVQKHH